MAHVKETARRWRYRGRQPHRLAALANRGTAAAAGAGIGPKRLVTLEVRGRRTGRRRLSVPVVVIEPGQRAPILRRYLQVAPRARAHFPVDRYAALQQFEPIAERYPVFRVCAAEHPGGEEATS